MSKKKNISGIVYSTDPGFKLTEENEQDEATISPAAQNLRIRLDNRQRAGKTVTLIQGFQGKDIDLQELGRKLKSFCGTGGAAKDREIIIQGDNRDKILSWLIKEGYSRSKKI